MAGPRVTLSPGFKQWQRRSLDTCCSKQVLLLLMWHFLFSFSWRLLVYIPTADAVVFNISMFLSFTLAPLVGLFADVKYGRYEVLKLGTIVSFLASILYYFAMFTEKNNSTLSAVLSSVAIIIGGFGYTCYSAAMLPFISDQIIGATSDELSAVVRWNYWARYLGDALSAIVIYFCRIRNAVNICLSSTLLFTIALAVIIISDCLCQQWLDRTHKVTNPIKLITQVLNYTRKHRYPERRSAFTYIDEEQPTRMDYGKEKFGGPFTEEEVEDVKTALRLFPLVIVLTISVIILKLNPNFYLFSDADNTFIWNDAIVYWLFPLLLIPLYQLLLYRCFRFINLSKIQCICIGLFICMLGRILLLVLGVVGVIFSDGMQKYLSCTALAEYATSPGDYIEWYWKLVPYILYGVGITIAAVQNLEFIIAQSPDKMKGLFIGLLLTFHGFVLIIISAFHYYTLCWDLSISLVLVALFVVFLILSKCYTLRERNREINIQAIVEEHYERYMDQEEEYRRDHPQYLPDSDSD